MKIPSIILLLCFATCATAGDVGSPTLEQLVQRTKPIYWGQPSTLRLFSLQVRELTKSADSIFAETIDRDLEVFDQEIADIELSSKSLLLLFTPPPRTADSTKKIIIGYVELLRHIHRVNERSGIINGKLHTYFKGKGVEKALDRIDLDSTRLRDAAFSSHEALTYFLKQEL